MAGSVVSLAEDRFVVYEDQGTWQGSPQELNAQWNTNPVSSGVLNPTEAV